MKINLRIKKLRYPTKSEREDLNYGKNWKVGERVKYVSFLKSNLDPEAEYTIAYIFFSAVSGRYYITLNTYLGASFSCKYFVNIT